MINRLPSLPKLSAIFLCFVILVATVILSIFSYQEDAEARIGCRLDITPCILPGVLPCERECPEVPYPFPGVPVVDNTGNQTAAIVMSEDDGTPRALINCNIRVGSFSANIVACVVQIVDQVAADFAENLGGRIRNIVSAVILLVVMLYFVRVALGNVVVGAGPTTMLLAFKVFFVLFYINSPVMTDAYRVGFFESSLGLSQEMVDNLPDDHGGEGASHCHGLILDGVDADTYQIFDYFDCIIRELLGYRIGVPPTCERGSETAQVPWDSPLPTTCASLPGTGWTIQTAHENAKFNGFLIGTIIFGLFFTGPLGAAITMLFLGIIFAIIVAVVRAMVLFLVSFMAVAILFGMGPIIVPLILFENTKNIFKMWFQFIIVYSLQPVMLVAFLTLTLSVLDQVSIEMGAIYDTVKEAISEDNCKLIETDEVVSADTSALPDDVRAEVEAAIADAAAPDSRITELRDRFTSMWSTLTSTVERWSTAVLDAIGDGFALLIPDIPCIKWPIGVMEVLFANLLAAFFILSLCIAFLRILPEMLDKLVAPTLVTSVGSMGSGIGRGVESMRQKINNSTGGGWSSGINAIKSAANYVQRR